MCVCGKGVGGEGVRYGGFCWHSTLASQLRFASTSIVNKTIYTELHDLHSLLVSVLKAALHRVLCIKATTIGSFKFI